MKDNRRIDELIRNTVPGLRHRWPKELQGYSDIVVAVLFNDFYFSPDAGNNDEKFPEWFQYLPEYQEEIGE